MVCALADNGFAKNNRAFAPCDLPTTMRKSRPLGRLTEPQVALGKENVRGGQIATQFNPKANGRGVEASY
jgi:hypothetical protein